MFSSFFGKRRSSPVEDNTPPIPGAKPDDGFVMIDPTSSSGGLYPNVSGNTVRYPYPQRPAPPAPPVVTRTEESFHYLQGVPFTLSKGLQMASNKDSITSEITDMLTFLASKLNMSAYDYDFSVERSVLKEC